MSPAILRHEMKPNYPYWVAPGASLSSMGMSDDSIPKAVLFGELILVLPCMKEMHTPMSTRNKTVTHHSWTSFHKSCKQHRWLRVWTSVGSIIENKVKKAASLTFAYLVEWPLSWINLINNIVLCWTTWTAVGATCTIERRSLDRGNHGSNHLVAVSKFSQFPCFTLP